MSGLRAVLLVGLVLVISSCKERGVIATLEEVTGQVERLTEAEGAWQPARTGATFRLGSAVRTGAASKARLAIGRGGVLLLDANALIRFESKPGKRHSDVQVETGSVEIEAGEDTIAFGDAVLEPGGKARLSNTAEGLEIRVSLGQVMLESSDGGVLPITAGNSIVVKIGGAILEETVQDAPPAPIDAGVADAPPDAPPDAPDPASMIVIKVTGPTELHTETTSRTLPPGEHSVDKGSRLTGAARSTIVITSDGARATVRGPSDVRVGTETGLISVVSGSIAVNAKDGDATVELPGGTMLVRSGGSDVEAKVSSKGTPIEIENGEIQIKTAAAEEELRPGDSIILSADGTITLKNRAPTRAAFSIKAGESPSIHDPRAPTALGIRFDGVCPGAGIVEVGRDSRFRKILARSGGRGRANVLVPPGSHAYRVRCDGGKGARGSLRVDKSTGRKPLPKLAPRTVVEADGREYVITYQNLLPELTLFWRDAPVRSNYRFVIVPASGDAIRLNSPTSRRVVKSGELPEGSYKFWVELPETGGRTQETRIVIDFDNAAASAAIEKIERTEGGKIAVRGSVVDGTSVSASGASVPLDRHRRFDAVLAPVDGEIGVAIRIENPKRGVHYYVISSGSK